MIPARWSSSRRWRAVCPVITTEQNGAGELMTDGREGYVLTSPGAEGELIAALDRMTDDATRRRCRSRRVAWAGVRPSTTMSAELLTIFQEVSRGQERPWASFATRGRAVAPRRSGRTIEAESSRGTWVRPEPYEPRRARDMQAVLLAGGKGTRLRPYTHVLPKPLMPLGATTPCRSSKSSSASLSRFGFRDVTIITGYLTELIEAFCGDGRKFGTRLQYRREVTPLGTAGGLTLLDRPIGAHPGHQRRHPHDARLRRDVRVPSAPRGGGDDRLLPSRGEDRLRRAPLRRRSSRLDRLSGEARVFVPGQHGRLHPRPVRLGFPDAGPVVADAGAPGIDAPERPRQSIATGRNATGWTSAGTTITTSANEVFESRRSAFLGYPEARKLKIGRDQ